MMKFTKSQRNSNKHNEPPGEIQPTAKQLETKTQKLGYTDVPPGGTFMPARRFLGENPKFCENNVIQQGFHAIQFI